MALRLVPVAVVVWGAALACVHAPDAAPGVAAALWAVAGATLLAGFASSRATRGRVHRHVVVILVVAAAAGAAAASHIALAQPARAAVAEAAILGGRALTVHATVVGKVERSGA